MYGHLIKSIKNRSKDKNIKLVILNDFLQYRIKYIFV